MFVPGVRMTSFKEVIEEKIKKITKVMPDLLAMWKNFVAENHLCERVSCEDCPAQSICNEHIGEAVYHIADAITELRCAKKRLSRVIAELGNVVQTAEQEVKC